MTRHRPPHLRPDGTICDYYVPLGKNCSECGSMAGENPHSHHYVQYRNGKPAVCRCGDFKVSISNNELQELKKKAGI